MNRLLNIKQKEDKRYTPSENSQGDKIVKVKNLLKGLGVEYRICNPNHIKVGRVNYYVSTGTCYIDGELKSLSGRGLDVFKRALNQYKD